MSEWEFIGYTKVHDDSRKHMIEKWIWRCKRCGHEERRPYGNRNKPSQCPKCGVELNSLPYPYDLKPFIE